MNNGWRSLRDKLIVWYHIEILWEHVMQGMFDCSWRWWRVWPWLNIGTKSQKLNLVIVLTYFKPALNPTILLCKPLFASPSIVFTQWLPAYYKNASFWVSYIVRTKLSNLTLKHWLCAPLKIMLIINNSTLLVFYLRTRMAKYFDADILHRFQDKATTAALAFTAYATIYSSAKRRNLYPRKKSPPMTLENSDWSWSNCSTVPKRPMHEIWIVFDIVICASGWWC